MNFIEQLKDCVPASPAAAVPWERIDALLAPAGFTDLKNTPQNPAYHGEGDCYTHTRMVCEALAGLPAFLSLPERQRTELYLAALLHDIGKVRTTRLENGSWTSPNHASAGAHIVREFLWRDCGVCGTEKEIVFRETVCALVRHHMLPVRLTERENSERRAREVASAGELASDFSWRLLCILAEADTRGRIADDTPDALTQIGLAEIAAEEAGCLDGPFPFADPFTRRAYLSGRNVPPDQTLYDGTWGEVILMSALPGTGKDTWIGQNCPGMPVISLDEIRKELRIRPTDDQGEAVRTARERAREYLRKKIPFVWNATNLTPDTRGKLIGLFEQYGARVRIVYLETDHATREARNAGREAVVPEGAVTRMLEKTVLPMPDEAQTVEWICT